MELDAGTPQRYLTNPLWTWRIANRRDAPEIDSALRWTRGRVESLELGASAPSEKELQQLSKLTGITDLSARWMRWAVEQPSASAAARR